MKENCEECKYHDIFWGGSGCLLLNNMEKCKFAAKEKDNIDHPTEKSGE